MMASVCFAATESPVSFASLRAVEASINDKMRSNVNDPYDLLGTARGSYLDGYGVVFTVEMNLVLVSPLNLSPFKPSISEKEVATMHDRKSRKVEELKGEMRDLMVGASKTLTGLPATEHLTMEAFLFNYKWENSRNLPKRIILTAGKQQLLDAANKHLSAAEIAKIFDEQEL
ncbi:MAG TPA: hypothetical protein VNH18_24085 [Bryobacteraceae bacterium]|nr:hypothetical protein [Bryobacteraceae bacterium]